MRRELPLCLLLAALALSVYWPATRHDFIVYDDDRYVTENAQVRAGLAGSTLEWALTAVVAGNWHPVTVLSHALDCELFGLDSGAHHLVSIGFHVANALLLLLLLHRMIAPLRCALPPISRRLLAFSVAALWAIHPLRVESVAWVAERKDVLSGFFFLLTLVAYVRYVEESGVVKPGGRKRLSIQFFIFNWYTAALGFFALGLMSKPMLVTLPFVLLLLDYWPLCRLQSSRSKEGSPLPVSPAHRPIHPPADSQRGGSRCALPVSATHLLLEKLPFFALAAAASVVTFLVQHRAGTTSMVAHLGLGDRVANALISYVQYLAKTFWPCRLSVFYPHPGSGGWQAWQIWGAALLLLAITVGLCAKFKVRSIDPAEAPTGGSPWHANFQFDFGDLRFVIARSPVLFGWLWFLGMLVPVIGLVQAGGQAMADRYTYLPAIGLVIAVVWALAQSSSAIIEARTLVRGNRRPTERHDPVQDQRAMNSGGLKSAAWLKFGVWGLVFLALCLSALQTRRQLAYWQNTATLFEHAAQIAPRSATIQLSLGLGLEKAGQPDLAMKHYRATLDLAPDESSAHFNLAQLLQQREQWPEAAVHYRAVLRIEPTNCIAHFGLGIACLRLGRLQEASREMAETLRLNPNPPPGPLNDLAWALATSPRAEDRDGPRAVQFAERACELTGYSVTVMVGTLAAAYAEAGRFDEALTTAEMACRLASAAGDQELLAKNQRLLELYRARRPYRE